MNKNTKKYILVSTYIIVLYLALSNIKFVLNGFYYIMNILSPLIIGGCIAFVLNILLKHIEKTIMKKFFHNNKFIYNNIRLISIILTYTFTMLIIITVILFIVPQVVESLKTLISALPQYGESLQRSANELYRNLGLSNETWNQLSVNWNEVTLSISKFTANTVNVLFNFTLNLTSSVLNFLIGLVFSIYILFSKEKLIRILEKLNIAYLNEKTSKRLIYILNEINHIFSKFIGGQVTEALILGLLCFIGMVILKIPYALLISVLIAITSLIPILGAYIGTIPAAFIIFMENPMQALIFIIFITILQQIEGNIIYPKVVGNAIGLDGFWVFLAIVIAGNMFGILGMLLGVPIMAVIYSLVKEVTDVRIEKIQK